MSDDDYKPPPLFNLGSKEAYDRFMNGEDAKEAEEEEKMDYEYQDVDKNLIPGLEKNKGREAFQKQDYQLACKHYSKAILALNFLIRDNAISTQEEMLKLIEEVQIPCHINLAICYCRLREYSMGLHFAKKAVDLDPENAKALYWKGLAQIELGDFKEARETLRTAQSKDANNQSIIDAFKLLDEKKRKADEKYKRISQKAFSALSADNESDATKAPPGDAKARAQTAASARPEEAQQQAQTGDSTRKNTAPAQEDPPSSLISTLLYHAKLALLLPLDFVARTLCKRRVPVQMLRKNQ